VFEVAEVKRVLVCGAGTMGSGIAQTFAAAGFDVTMYDLNDELVQAGFAKIKGPLMKRVDRGKMKKEDVEAVIGRIQGSWDLAAAGKQADFVVEAVFENMDTKKQVFKQLDEAAPAHAILASNTSSLSISEMAAATKRPDRVIGMHFFNPAPVMRLVEVIRGAATSDETVAASKAVAVKLGKKPVEVQESPGFVVNRLLVPMMNEAFNLLQEGVASADDIDTAMKLGTNMPMGPFELADYTGLDIGLHTMETLFRETGDPKFRPSPLLRKYVRAGRVGKKVGKGVFEYNERGERVS
jgi:3-hydroxybutyryl-CoA dehydrogenase